MGLYVATYAASVAGLTPGATPQDIFTIQAAANKLVQVLYTDIAFDETTGATVDIFLLKRSTANSGGTSAAATAVPFDSADVAATATVQSYTANPATPGTLVGVVAKDKLFGGVVTALTGVVVEDFDKPSRKPIILRPGSQETLAWNLNGIASPAGALFDINIIWTEE